MKKIFLGLFLIFGLAIGFLNLDIKAGEPTYAPVSYTYTINKDGVPETPTTVNNINYGTSVNFDFGTAPTGYTFVGHINQNKLVSTGTNSVSINVTENTEVEYLFKTNNSTAVIFKDTNLDFVSILLADGSGIITGYPNITSYSKPGLTTTDWTDGTNTYTQAALATQVFSAGTTTILYPIYTTTQNVSLSVTSGSIENLTTPGTTYKFNDIVRVTANGTGTFNYWTKDGVTVSYEPSYTFTVAAAHDLVAVYDEDGFVSPTDNFVNVSAPYELKDGYQTLIGQFNLADGETLVEYGFVHSNTETTPTLSTAETLIDYSNKFNSTTNEFVMSFSKTTYALSNYYRAFIATINGTTVNIKYSDPITNPIDFTQVWFYKSNDWSYVNAYTYVGETYYLGGWPGSSMINENGTDWWYIYLPSNLMATINIIFNNNNGSSGPQTGSITFTTTNDVFVSVLGDVFASKQLLKDSSTKVWFQNYWEEYWGVDPNIWAWDASGNLFLNYPGPDMNYEFTDSTGRNWYSFDIFTSQSTFGVEIVADTISQDGGRKYNVTGLDSTQSDVYLYWNGSEWTYSYTNPVTP